MKKAEPIGNCGTNKPDILPDDLPIFNPNPKDNISLVTLKLVRPPGYFFQSSEILFRFLIGKETIRNILAEHSNSFITSTTKIRSLLIHLFFSKSSAQIKKTFPIKAIQSCLSHSRSFKVNRDNSDINSTWFSMVSHPLINSQSFCV